MAEQLESTVTIWLDGEPYEDTLSRVLKLEVDERTDGATTLHLSLDLAPSGTESSPTADRNWDLLADGRFALLHAITVELGVGPPKEEPTARAIVFHGYVTSVEPHFGEARVPDSGLEIFALDASCLMHLEERTVSHVGKTDAEIVRGIYESYGFGADIEATSPVRTPDRGPLVQRTTDAEFVRLLARRHGFEAYFERQDAAPVKKGAVTGAEMIGHFHGARIAAATQPALELMPREAPSLRTFRARWESHRPTTVLAAHIDERTRRIRRSEIKAPRFARMGSTSRADILTKRMKEILPKRPDSVAIGRQISDVPYDQAELDEFARAEYQDADWLVEATGVVEGLRYPTILRARRPIDLRGAGPLLDGKWYVGQARHRWERDVAVKRYEVDVALVRDALGGVG
jgi:phage protein D